MSRSLNVLSKILGLNRQVAGGGQKQLSGY